MSVDDRAGFTYPPGPNSHRTRIWWRGSRWRQDKRRAILAILVVLLVPRIAGDETGLRSTSGDSHSIAAAPPCGGHLTSRRGVISTPGFPSAFPVPISCRWVLDASNLTDAPNTSIIVYLSQLYAYRGLSFTEYAYYSEGFSIGGSSLDTVDEGNVFDLRWLKTQRPYLVVEFKLDRLEGNHVRVLDKLLDVYGFNLTYEMIEGRENPSSCSLRECSFAGNCLLASDYATFYCDCFEGFGGEHCGHGPLCVTERGNPICQNGGTCRHVGAAAVRCLCMPRFSGDFCEISSEELDQEEDGCRQNCIFQCPVVAAAPGDQHHQQRPCRCKKPNQVHGDRTRFECRIKLTNVTRNGVDFIGRNVSLELLLSKQLAKYVRDSKISSVEDLKILSITPALEVNFHFFGETRDADKIRSSLNRLVQHRRLGDLFLEPSHFTFQLKPALKLQTLKINQGNARPVHVGEPFILSCVAVGGSDLKFAWYKDDMLVNMSKATREIWYRHLPTDGADYHTSILTVERAELLDEGRYTCQVVEWGLQQCKSLHVAVVDDPSVKITPMSSTVEKGSTIRVMCTTPNMRSVGIGFGWTKNRALLRLDPGHEVWEDLYPAGSVLTINHARNSATYTCNVAHKSASMRLEVVNSSLVPLCPADSGWGLRWPRTAPGTRVHLDCPQGHRAGSSSDRQPEEGHVTRQCAMRDSENTEWETPDFSGCLYEPLLQPLEDFRRLALGYESTNGSSTLQAFWDVLQYRRTALYPGEGDRIISLLQEVEHYQRNIDELDELKNSAEAVMRIINKILANGNSILNQEKMISLSQLVVRSLGYWNQDSADSHKHLSLPEVVADVLPMKVYSSSINMYSSKVPQDNQQNKYPDWYNERVTIRLYHNRLQNNNKTVSGIVVVYRNLAQFFPDTYITELEDGSDMEYRISSRVVSVSTPSHWGPDRDEQLSIELEFAGARDSTRTWNSSCGVLGPGGNWNLDGCTPATSTEHDLLEDNTALHCFCTSSGTFAAFLTARSESSALGKNERGNFMVILGCGSCLLMCLVTTTVLTVYWWRNRTWLNFLKIQCCLAVIAAMTTFIYAVCVDIPKDDLSMVAISLEAFLLIGTSSPISQALIIYAELSNIHPSQQFQPTVVAVITGVPILAILTTELTRKTIGWKHESWWLIYNTRVYYIFVICSITMLFTFLLLYVVILHKTKPLLYKFTKKDIILLRIRMLHHSAVVILGIVAMEVSSILYVNSPSIVFNYLFSIQSILLGFIILVMYVICGEVLVVNPVLHKLKRQSMADDDSASERARVRSKERELDRELSSASSVTQLPATLLLTGVCDPSVTAGIYPGETRGVAAGMDYMNEAAASAFATRCASRGMAAGAPEIQIHHVDEHLMDPVYKVSPRACQQQRLCEEVTTVGYVATNFCGVEAYHPAIEITQPYKELVTLGGIHSHPANCPSTILCNAQVETCLGPGMTTMMPDVTLAINGDADLVNKSPIIVAAPVAPNITEQTYVLCKEPVPPSVVVTAIPDIMEQRKQPDGEDVMVKPIVRRCDVILEEEPITTTTTNGMLEQISHDLDYLLNRTKEDGR